MKGVKMTSRVLAVLAAVALLGGCEKIVYRDSPTGSTPVAEATPAPAAPTLRFPQGVPEAEQVGIPGIPTLHDVINQELAAMFPNCEIGQARCDGLGYNPASFFSVLSARLRARGYWAGQDLEWQRDELSVARDCKGEWENFHAWDYNGSPLWARPVSQPCAGHACTGKGTSYRGNWIIPAMYCR
jgi:hypothetical protein